MGERRRRNKMLTILSEKKKRAFYESQLGQVRPVLFEQAKEDGRMSGFTDNYVRVDLPEDEALLNQVRAFELAQILPDNGFVIGDVKEEALS